MRRVFCETSFIFFYSVAYQRIAHPLQIHKTFLIVERKYWNYYWLLDVTSVSVENVCCGVNCVYFNIIDFLYVLKNLYVVYLFAIKKFQKETLVSIQNICRPQTLHRMHHVFWTFIISQFPIFHDSAKLIILKDSLFLFD